MQLSFGCIINTCLRTRFLTKGEKIMAERAYKMEEVPPDMTEREQKAKGLATLVYILQAIGLFVGVTYIAAVVVNYVKADDVKGTWLESHFRWQIRTFWFSLLWAAIGVITFLIIIGYFVLIADGIWVVYRIVKGFLYLRDGREMYRLAGA